ncbi:MAG: carbohydrate binding family 9 domain-containing protein [Acidobacteria bacterium]|nr:carbohydrate binding family 9 domain-containing protein [Acidobacteriota bacterium]
MAFASAAAEKIDYGTARLERRLQAVAIQEPLVIDGKLDESAWSQAAVARNFLQREPREGEPATEPTEVRLLYDRDHLYFGVTAFESEIDDIIISDLKKDFNPDQGDSFEIILDTFHDKRNAYRFATNPGGAKWDAQMSNEGREQNVNWDGVWYVQVRITETAWIAEIAIPFKTLKFRVAEVQTWGINFERYVRRKNEDSHWAPVPRIYGIQRVSLAGTLEDLREIEPGFNLKVKPYVLSMLGKIGEAGADYDGDIGLDLKYGLTTGLTWDFTYNTDFSQVEADEQQVNLTRFSLFFPEKRDFFLENSGIFQFGAGPDRGPAVGGGGGGAGPGAPPRLGGITEDNIFFFSRRIGLDERLGVIPIVGGTRLTGRIGQYELGFLDIQQDELGTLKATNFMVGRLKRNILANSDVGVIVTNKDIQDSQEFNRLIGADANLRFGQYLNINGYMAKSYSRVQQPYNMAGRFGVRYQDRIWEIRGSYTDIQQNFRNEMGFVPRTGIRDFLGYFGRAFRPRSINGTIREIKPHLQIDYFLDPQGNLDTRLIDYHLPLNFQDGSFVEMGVNATLERLNRPFEIRKGILIPPGVYSFNEAFFTGRSSSKRKIAGNLRWSAGRFYTGYRHSYTLGSTTRPHYRFNILTTYTHNNVNLPQGPFKTNLLTLRFNYSFSTAMFLNALIQYNSDARQWSSNIRFNIIHRPLSDLFIVYNERRDSTSGDLLERALIGKLTYMWSR